MKQKKKNGNKEIIIKQGDHQSGNWYKLTLVLRGGGRMRPPILRILRALGVSMGMVLDTHVVSEILLYVTMQTKFSDNLLFRLFSS